MKKHAWAVAVGAIGLALVLAASTGCHRGKKQPLNPELANAGGGTVTPNENANLGDQPTLTAEQLAQLLFGSSGLKTIYFDYDSSALTASAMDTLRVNADLIKQAAGSGILIQLAGNCDERGTQEYNLALGERRALAARDYLISLGAPADQMITISYGEENPAVDGHDESAWSQNRRVEFLQAQGR